MDYNDRQAIERLFANLGDVERQSASRDHEAEQFITQRIASQPGAPYFMAQTIVVQEQALEMAENRIAELEHALNTQPRQGGGGFFASLFGSGQSPQPVPRQQPYTMGRQPEPEAQPQQPASPWARQPAAPGAGGGFLAGAAQTAMGVAGGVMLGNALGSMFGGSEAKAAEKPEEKDEPQDEGDDDEGFDLGF